MELSNEKLTEFNNTFLEIFKNHSNEISFINLTIPEKTDNIEMNITVSFKTRDLRDKIENEISTEYWNKMREAIDEVRSL